MTYAVVRPVFWRALRGASDRALALASYLLTSDHRRAAGLLRVPVAHAAADLAWTARKVEATLAELAAVGFLLRDPAADLVYVTGWRDHDPLANCGHACAVARALRDHAREAPASPAVRASALALREEAARLLGLAPASDAAAPQLRKLLDNLPRGDGPPHGPPDGPRDPRGGVGEGWGSAILPRSNNSDGGSAPASPGVGIPLKDGTGYQPTAAQLAEWRAAYPGVDVAAELRKAAAWAAANPAKRKTRRGAPAFIVGWLGRAKPTAPARPATPAPTAAELKAVCEARGGAA